MWSFSWVASSANIVQLADIDLFLEPFRYGLVNRSEDRYMGRMVVTQPLGAGAMPGLLEVYRDSTGGN